MFKQATKLRLRFTTTKGILTTEQLWDLTLTDLSAIIKVVKKQLKGSEGDDELSFLDSTKTTDVENQLRFDILKDIYLTKKADSEAIRTAADKKAQKAKLAELIAKKEDGALENKSLDDLKKMYAEI